MERILHSGYVFKVCHPNNPLFVCFVELSQGTQDGLLSDWIKSEDRFLGWIVSRGLQPLMALTASSIPLHVPTLDSVDSGSPVAAVSPHRPTPIASHYSAVWAPIQMLQPGSCWFTPLLIWTAAQGLWTFQFNWSMSTATSSALQVVNFKICRLNSLIVCQGVHAPSMSLFSSQNSLASSSLLKDSS